MNAIRSTIRGETHGNSVSYIKSLIILVLTVLTVLCNKKLDSILLSRFKRIT